MFPENRVSPSARRSCSVACACSAARTSGIVSMLRSMTSASAGLLAFIRGPPARTPAGYAIRDGRVRLLLRLRHERELDPIGTGEVGPRGLLDRRGVELPVRIRQRPDARGVLVVLILRDQLPDQVPVLLRVALEIAEQRFPLVADLLRGGTVGLELLHLPVHPLDQIVEPLRIAAETDRDGEGGDRNPSVAGARGNAVGAAEVLADRLEQPGLEDFRHRAKGHAVLLCVLERPGEEDGGLALRLDAFLHALRDDAGRQTRADVLPGFRPMERRQAAEVPLD